MTRLGFASIVIATLLVSSLAFAQRGTARPSARTLKRNMVTMTEHPNNFRWAVMRDAGLTWGDHAVVHQIGATRDGMSLVTIRSSKLAKPEIYLARRVREGNGRYSWTTTKVDHLTNQDLRTLNLVSGPVARSRAAHNGGKFANVRGRMRYAGTSRSGESYKIEITPAQAIQIRETYGTQTVRKLMRYVHINGTETAAVTDGEWHSNRQPVRRTRPVIAAQ